jgi:ribosomal protein L11 methylase PrmA
MKLAQPNQGSFRDPRGQIYHFENRILRTVNPIAKADFEFVQSSGLFEKLIANKQLLPYIAIDKTILVDQNVEVSYLLEHPRLEFISYPYEWSFAALKAAALLHLDIQLQALELGVTLTDASAYNIQFQGSQPVFIDHLSFTRYEAGMIWQGYQQFCQQFLNPLLLQNYLGIHHQTWYRGNMFGIQTADLNKLLSMKHKFSPKIWLHVILPTYFQKISNQEAAQVAKKTNLSLHALKNLLNSIKNWIEKLNYHKNNHSAWKDYAEQQVDNKIKREFISDFVQQLKPSLLFDLGCNSGEYAALALQNGAKKVVGFDADQSVLEKAFMQAAKNKLAFLPLYMDLTNPSPKQGWKENERNGFVERNSADAILVLALLHHLVIANDIPFNDLISWLITLAPQGVIEFVPKNDPKVQELLQLRSDIFVDYTYENFLQYLQQAATIIKETKISASGRTLVWYQRK